MNPSVGTESVIVKGAELSLIPSFYKCLDSVARERIFIEMIEAPPLELVAKFQTDLIGAGGPVSYAVRGREVVGWCDVFKIANPRQHHRGVLGMGVHKDFRGQGLGSRLMEHTLTLARDAGLEKIELQVYTSNVAAIRLYESHGFEREGLMRKYRRLDEVDFDSLLMAKFL